MQAWCWVQECAKQEWEQCSYGWLSQKFGSKVWSDVVALFGSLTLYYHPFFCKDTEGLGDAAHCTIDCSDLQKKYIVCCLLTLSESNDPWTFVIQTYKFLQCVSETMPFKGLAKSHEAWICLKHNMECICCKRMHIVEHKQIWMSTTFQDSIVCSRDEGQPATIPFYFV